MQTPLSNLGGGRALRWQDRRLRLFFLLVRVHGAAVRGPLDTLDDALFCADWQGHLREGAALCLCAPFAPFHFGEVGSLQGILVGCFLAQVVGYIFF